ncbi:hypothetical protein [Streptomyces kaniharaensis]|uniref:hypothetical protein n=1 Tax=Streptomyces kaniharaensis TaxID=212423 RepID=UPI001297AD9B|nr:hypothetical protein [Streptomyces kaniharaensis]
MTAEPTPEKTDEQPPARDVTAVLDTYVSTDPGTGATNFTNYADNGFSKST